MKTEPDLSPRAEVERAKSALLARPVRGRTAQHPAVRLVQEHPIPAAGAALAAGFLIVAFKPGRVMLRQVAMAGTSVMLRRALLKYIRSS
ncbi:hypothetical protein OT109_18625 [Phycisphaeraceae bacterium D3-23]